MSKLFLLLLLLSLGSTAILNPFHKINDQQFIKIQIFNFLSCKDRVRIMVTCRTFYQFLKDDFDHVIYAISGLKDSYTSGSLDLKEDVRNIWKYYEIERETEGTPFPFQS